MYWYNRGGTEPVTKHKATRLDLSRTCLFADKTVETDYASTFWSSCGREMCLSVCLGDFNQRLPANRAWLLFLCLAAGWEGRIELTGCRVTAKERQNSIFRLRLAPDTHKVTLSLARSTVVCADEESKCETRARRREGNGRCCKIHW